jgi:hypothetical protein
MLKSGKVHKTALYFVPEDFGKATLVKYMITTWTKDYIPFENLKLCTLQAAVIKS